MHVQHRTVNLLFIRCRFERDVIIVFHEIVVVVIFFDSRSRQHVCHVHFVILVKNYLSYYFKPLAE